MSGLKKFVWGLAAAIFAVNLLASAGHAAANEARERDGRAYLESVCREMGALTGFHGDVAVDVKSPLFTFSAMTNFDVFQGKEWILKADTESVFFLSGHERHKMRIAQYLEKKPGEIVCYANTGKRWLKSAVQDKEMTAGPDASEMKRLLKKVEVRDDNGELAVLEVVVDMEKASEIAADVFLEQAKKSAAEKSAEEMKMLDATGKMQDIFMKAVRHMGDVSYIVTVDKKSNRAVNVMVDMTRALQKSMAFVLADMRLNKEQKAAAEFALKNTRVVIQEDFSRFNEVEPFSIPAAVVKKAVDAEAYKKKMEEKVKRAS